MHSSGARFARRVPAVPASVPQLRHDLTRWAAASGVHGEALQAIRLGVTEAMTNAIMHAYIERPQGTVRVGAEPGQDTLTVRVADDGRGMGPRPDSPGLGMGLPLIGSLCATVDLGSGPGGQGTEVRMVFGVPGMQPADPGDESDIADIVHTLQELGSSDGFRVQDIGVLTELVVPRLADLCSVTLLDAGNIARRVAARVTAADGSVDPAAGEWMLHFPVMVEGSPSRQAATTGRSSVAPVDLAFAREISPDDASADELMQFGFAWWAALPLSAAGVTVGAVTLAGRPGRGAPGPVVTAVEQIVARAGGLVATARLVDDLRRAQRRLDRILEAIGEAVTVADADGRVVYANSAALALLGAEHADEILHADPTALAATFELTDEAGASLTLEDMPHRRLFAGLPAVPVVTHAVHRPTGRARWLRTTATLLEDDGPLAVSVIQDVTAEYDRRGRSATRGRPKRPPSRS